MFGRKKDAGEGKKKKGCLRRLFGMVFGAVAVVVVLAFLLDDGTDYISDEEQSIADSEEDAMLDDLIDLFFDWYGFIPEDDDSYNFMDNSAYADYDYDDYYDNYDDYYGYGYGYGDDYDDYDYSNWYGEGYYDDYDSYGYDDDSDYGYSDYYGYDSNQNTTTEQKPKPSTEQSTKPKTEKKKNTEPASQRREKFIKCAEYYMGAPYKPGGNSRAGIDCSGLVYQAAIDAGLGTLPRRAKDMYSIASSIKKEQAERGDLVFFKDGSSVSHVAIYIGDNMLLHSISDGSKTGVVTSKLTNKYWKEHYYGMGRIISD
ncbi:MAG: C40 family peptidase [Treponema sp.]|nr:C40 family peptidase [Treponema sp.]